MKLTPFEVAILTALNRCPYHWCRLDGLQCDPAVTVREWWFFHYQLWRMKRKGLVKARRFYHSEFRSANAIPFYLITEVGQKAIEDHAS